MKKLIIVFIVMLGLMGCNRQLIDTTWNYDTAIIRWPDGSAKTIKISSWRDYEGEQIQITDRDGNVYLLSSMNAILINTNR